MNDRFEGLTPREIIKKTRHKAELPLKRISVILTVVCFVLVSVGAMMGQASPEIEAELVTSFAKEDPDGGFVEIFIALGFTAGIILALGLALMFIVSAYRMYAKQMSYSVKVTPVNFPEIYNKAQEYTEVLGLKKMPEVYITQQNGVLNAFATFVPGKRYVQLNAEILDVAYMEHKDLEPVFFTLGHEFGHIYLGHVNLSYLLFTMAGRMIPFFGFALSRAQEYSADRVGQALTSQKSSERGMAMLGAGRHLYPYVDPQDYLESINNNHNFLERLNRFIVNINASHPIMPFRMAAILDEDRRSGRIL